VSSPARTSRRYAMSRDTTVIAFRQPEAITTLDRVACHAILIERFRRAPGRRRRAPRRPHPAALPVSTRLLVLPSPSCRHQGPGVHDRIVRLADPGEQHQVHVFTLAREPSSRPSGDCRQFTPVGGLSAGDGRQGSMKPARPVRRRELNEGMAREPRREKPKMGVRLRAHSSWPGRAWM
jgi:hypothetical protein